MLSTCVPHTAHGISSAPRRSEVHGGGSAWGQSGLCVALLWWTFPSKTSFSFAPPPRSTATLAPAGGRVVYSVSGWPMGHGVVLSSEAAYLAPHTRRTGSAVHRLKVHGVGRVCYCGVLVEEHAWCHTR